MNKFYRLVCVSTAVKLRSAINDWNKNNVTSKSNAVVQAALKFTLLAS
jgi:hypothetical protein